MSRIFVRSIANIGKLMKNVRNVPLKSNTLISCNVKCVPSMMQSFGRSYSSKAEQSLGEYLKKEIKLRRENSDAPAENVGEFNVQKLDGADVELFREYNDEKITITFNTNGNIESCENCDTVWSDSSDESDWSDSSDSSDSSDYSYDSEYPSYSSDSSDSDYSDYSDEDSKKEYLLVSKPSFTVKIDRDTEKNLVLDLGFISCENIPKDGQNFGIFSFAMAKNGEDYNTTNFSLGEDMDQGIREYLIMMLEQRGVNQDFVKELKKWISNYDNKMNLKRLEDLNKQVI